MTDGDNQFSKLPVPNLGSTPNPGDSLYLVNYEPDGNSIDRNPNASANPVSQAQIHSLPAIYSAVYLTSAGGKYIIATGIKSYGKGVPDTMSRPGASGGPVFNASGQLVGIIVSIQTDKYTSQNLSALYNVNNSDFGGSRQLQIEEVQPITQSLINTYSALAANRESGTLCQLIPVLV